MVVTRLTLWIDGDRIAVLGRRDPATSDGQMLNQRGLEAPLAEVLADLLTSARNGRTEVVAVVGYPDVHVREVPSLPFGADESDVRAALDIDLARYVRVRSTGSVLLGVWKGSDSWIVADCDAGTADAIVAAGLRSGVAVRAIVPEVSARAAAGDGELGWIAAGASISVRAERQTAVSVQTKFASAPRVDEPLFDLPSHSARRLPGCYEPGAASRGVRARRLRRAFLIASACSSLAAGSLAPGLGAWWVGRRADRELARLSATETFTADSLAALASYRARADAIARFEQLGRAASFDIGLLAEALPDGSAVLSLDVDSTTIRVVVLAPEGSKLLPGTTLDDRWTELSLLGPIVKEPVEGLVFERVAFEMRLREKADVRAP